MVERIVISAAVLLTFLVLMLGLPRFRSDGGWPDILGRLDSFAASWVERPRVWDIALGVLTIAVWAATIVIYQDPSVIGGVTFVAYVLGILGFIGLFATSHLSVRRAGLPGAEATLVGSSLAGVVLIVLIVGLLIS